MKHGKKLTRAQADLLRDRDMDPAQYLRVKDLPRLLQVVHRVTGKYELILKGDQ